MAEVLVLSLILTILYGTYRQYTLNEKQRAWIITSFASIILSLYGLYVLALFAWISYDMEFLLNYTLAHKLSHNEMFPHHLFASYLILDLVIGMIDYPKQINLMTGWVHHIMYLIICWFYQDTKYSMLMILCYIVEIPTFILALCKFYPNNNLLKNIFTTVFFIFRICGLGFITIKCMMIGVDLGVMISFILSLCLNGYWFLKLIKMI